MFAKKSFNNKSYFEDKYALYGDMLYRLGLIYFGPGKDYLCQEAMSEAFLWLITRKKGFKNPEKEKMELIGYMVLICESKSRRKPNSEPQMEEEMSVYTSFSESMDILDAIYRLPSKYKPVLHLALFEDLDESQISKILSIPCAVVNKLLVRGTELMEIVLEKSLSRDCYCRMMNECKTPPGMKEEIYLYLTEGKPHVKTYLSPRQKVIAALAAIAIAALCMGAIRIYPVLKPVINTKYAFMNGTIHSITLSPIYKSNTPGVLFSSSGNGYQGYTLNGNSLKPLETRHITKTIEYAGQQFEADFYYCIKDGYVAVMNNSYNSMDKGTAYIYPSSKPTEKVLVGLYRYNYENEEDSFTYHLIMDINTLDTTDFISDCGISDYDHMININLNTDLPGAIICTKNNDIYYLDINSSSSIKLASIENGYLYHTYFYDDETLLYSTSGYNFYGISYIKSYYKYSIKTNTTRKCYEFDARSGKEILLSNANNILLRNPDNTCSIVDIITGTSTNIPHIQNVVDELYSVPQYSPDEKRILFEKNSWIKRPNHYIDEIMINKIYIYDIDTKKTLTLNLSDYKVARFANCFWYDNDHIALFREDFALDGTDSSGSSEETDYTLIFDLNKLH